MSDYNKTHLRNIKMIFAQKTGVAPVPLKKTPRPIRRAVILAAAMLCCLCAAAFTAPLFSGIDGGDLALRSVYDGNGTVTVFLENRSDKELRITDYKLMRWNTGEVILTSADFTLAGEAVPAGKNGVMTADLSAFAERLETPLPNGDYYYLLLTNNRFLFGYDYMCSVDFVPAVPEADGAKSDPLYRTNIEIPEKTEESLRFYFEADTRDPAVRRELTAAYAEAYTDCFARNGVNPVPSVSPVLPGNRIDPHVPRLSLKNPGSDVIFDETFAGDQSSLAGSNWFSMDAGFKLIAAEGEYALTVSAGLPSKKYGDIAGTIPLLYVLTYEKADIASDSLAFIYGQLIPFSDLEQLAVYEDDTYICYEVSELIYTDLNAYAEQFAAQDSSIRFDADTLARICSVYEYYKEHLRELLYFINAA